MEFVRDRMWDEMLNTHTTYDKDWKLDSASGSTEEESSKIKDALQK